MPARDLLKALRRPEEEDPIEELPHIWPGGPKPGVYVTTQREHIDALLTVYDQATDGTAVYAERAGIHGSTSIDLGEHGLWSGGMDSVPSGALLVLGPLELNQESWNDTASRLEGACSRARANRHRVAVLLETETPHTLFHDVDLMVRMKEPDANNAHEALLGVVTAQGDLMERTPFVSRLPAPVFRPSHAPVDALPAQAIPLLCRALDQRPTGLLLLGSTERAEHKAAAVVNAALTLTDFAGPAARIHSSRRSTPSPDCDVPEAMKQLPVLPSVQSAYSLGYRRMVIAPDYIDEDLLDAYADDVLFIGGTYGGSVEDTFLSAVRYRDLVNVENVLDQHNAILAVTHLKTGTMDAALADMYIPELGRSMGENKLGEILASFRNHRCLRAEEELEQLLVTKAVTPEAVHQALFAANGAAEYLIQREMAPSNLLQ